MDKLELFAKNLEAIRKVNGQSLAEFAKEIGIPKSTLQSIRISGNTTLNTAIQISEGLKIPLDSLVNDDRLVEKINIVRYLLHGLDGLQALSIDKRSKIVLHVQKILEVTL